MRFARAIYLLPLLASCSMLGGDEGDWAERQVAEAPPRRELLAYCAQAMAQAGYPAPRVDEARDAVVSEWRLELQPFAGAGRRFRATIELAGYDRDVGLLRARVEAEKNAEKGRPMDPVLADWETMPDDVNRSRILLQHVVSLLVTSGAGGA
ncbi:MAG: hypothetical protein O3A20_07380 [Planctomycetota bacterium]|nr:hypothetical protein [Planctomycetota bacterium]